MLKQGLREFSRVLAVGAGTFFGVTFTLRAYGLIEPWGGDIGPMHELWKEPWCALAAVAWLGWGVLFFPRR